MSYSSIVDVPKKALEADFFGIDKYKNGLIKFIRNSDTPITIALQGEWGSGKTSLLNALQHELCGPYTSGSDHLKSHQHEFYGIWINTWQYSLMRSQEETLISIVTAITNQILEIIKSRHMSGGEKVTRTLFNWISRGVKSAASYAADRVIGDGASAVVDSLLSDEAGQHTIKDLRDNLQEAVLDCLRKDEQAGKAKKGFIFFIDDLDRVDPPVAVQILELLKNIFDLHQCIFILAIDYDVVVKGLRPKFGELNATNEREFRSFFDKIIQMPFSMPVATYVIDRFLIDNLKRIGYLIDTHAKNNEFAEKISMICSLSVGTNPRSLKRLLNTISLITIINNELEGASTDARESDYLLVNFGLICIQIAYPPIYKSLSMEGDFTKWDEAFAQRFPLRALAPHELDKLNQLKEFDDDWEKILYRICEKDTYLSNRASQISQLLNLMASCSHDGGNLGEMVAEMIELSSVTDVQAFDKPIQAINRGPVLKEFSAKILPLLKAKLPATFPTVRQQSKKVQSNLYIAYSKPSAGWKDFFGATIISGKEGFTLQIWVHPWIFTAKSKSLRDDLRASGCIDRFEEQADNFSKLLADYPAFSMRYPGIPLQALLQTRKKENGMYLTSRLSTRLLHLLPYWRKRRCRKSLLSSPK